MRQKFKFQALEITFYRVYKSWDLFWGKQALKITTKSVYAQRGVGEEGVVAPFEGVNPHTCWNFADQKPKALGYYKFIDSRRQKKI